MTASIPSRSQKITFAEMRDMGVGRGMLLCLLLSACSSDKVEIGGSPVVYVPPSAPTQDAVPHASATPVKGLHPGLFSCAPVRGLKS